MYFLRIPLIAYVLIMTMATGANAAGMAWSAIKNKKQLAAELKSYVAAKKAQSKPKRVATSTENGYESVVNDLINEAKQSLRHKDPLAAKIILDAALELDGVNQKAHFYRAIAVLGTNPEILAKMQELNLIDANALYIPNASFRYPDIISFKEGQRLSGKVIEQILEAKRNLSMVKESFYDDVSLDKLGTARLDYAAVELWRMFLSMLEMKAHLANAYDTDNAHMTKKEMGYLSVIDLSPITEDPQKLFNDLKAYDYINQSGKVTNRYLYLAGSSWWINDPIKDSALRSQIYNILRPIAEQPNRSLQKDLDFYPLLLANKADSAAVLNSAKMALIEAVDSYVRLDDYLRRRDAAFPAADGGINYVIRAYQKPGIKALTQAQYDQAKRDHLKDADAIKSFMLSIKNNLLNSSMYPTVVIPDHPSINKQLYGGLLLNLSAVFELRDNRSIFERINNQNRKYGMITEKFNHADNLGRFFPLAKQGDLNFMLGAAPAIKAVTNMSGTTNYRIVWSSISGLPKAATVDAFELWRSEKADMSDALLIARPSKGATAHVDNISNPRSSVYYYRLHTKYQFSDDKAVAYSNVFMLTLPSIPNRAPVISTRRAPVGAINAGMPLAFFVDAKDPDFEPVALSVMLANGDPLSSIGAEYRASNGFGVFLWREVRYLPGGVLNIVFTARDQKGLSASLNLPIMINKPDLMISNLGWTTDVSRTKAIINVVVSNLTASKVTSAFNTRLEIKIQTGVNQVVTRVRSGFRYKNKTTLVPVYTTVVRNIAFDSLRTPTTKSIEIPFNPQYPYIGGITATVDSGNNIVELNEGNNQLIK